MPEEAQNEKILDEGSASFETCCCVMLNDTLSGVHLQINPVSRGFEVISENDRKVPADSRYSIHPNFHHKVRAKRKPCFFFFF